VSMLQALPFDLRERNELSPELAATCGERCCVGGRAPVNRRSAPLPFTPDRLARQNAIRDNRTTPDPLCMLWHNNHGWLLMP